MTARGAIFGSLFDYGVDILVTTFSKLGTITAQLGDAISGKPDADNAEWWQHAGFTSRPAVPTSGGVSCQGIVLKNSDRDIVIASRDTRGTAILGNLADGEACAYAPGSQAAAYFKANGSARLMTTDNNKSGGNAIQCGISAYYQGLDGQQHLGGEFRYAAPWGGAWHDPTGYHLRTWHGVKIDAGGANVSLSGLSLGGASYTVTADMQFFDAAQLVLGRDNGTNQALVQALPLQAQLGSALSSLASATTSLAAAVAAFTGSGTFPGLPAAQTALSSAQSSLTAAIAALTTTCATHATTAS